MKGWMGGKRRHIAVRRKDPAARQRQEFARRRELARLAINRNQNKGAQMSMDMIQSHAARPPRPQAHHRKARPQAPQNAPRWTGRHTTKPLPYSTDFAMVEDPSQLASVEPAYRNARKRARDQAEREERESKRRNLSLRDDQNRTFETNYPSQDIRIFDADDEKTPLFRRRILPESFLNSEVTNKQHTRTSKYFAKENTSPSKRLKVSTPDLSARLEQLKFSPAHRVERFNRVSRDVPRHSRKANERFEVPEQSPHLPARLSDSFRKIRPLSEHYRQSMSIPAADVERPEMVSDRTRDQVHRMARRHVPESPEHVRHSPSGWKVVDLGSRSQSPVLSARNMDAFDSIRSTRLQSRFPLIEAESDSPPILSPVKKQAGAVIGFPSLLALEPMTADDFSAEVQVLEARMFERPDSDGGRFKARRKRLQRGAEGAKHGMMAGDDQRFKSERVGGTSSATLNKERFSGIGDVNDAIPKTGTNEHVESGKDTIPIDPDAQSKDIVDVTLITTERSPINVARGKRSGRDQVMGIAMVRRDATDGV